MFPPVNDSFSLSMAEQPLKADHTSLQLEIKNVRNTSELRIKNDNPTLKVTFRNINAIKSSNGN